MLKKTSVAALAFLLGSGTTQALSVGDLAFTSFNADEDGWSMVTFVDIAANTTIFFTDNEWNGLAIGSGGAFNTGESYHQWNTGSGTILAGTVIRFSAIDNATTLAASVGSLTRATVSGSTNYGISQTADTIYAYEGSSASTPTTFLSAISTGGFSAAEGQLTNTGLSVGVNAIQLSAGSDYAEYSGPRNNQTTFAGYKPLVAGIGNWTDSGDGNFAATVPNTTAFTVVPVPAALPLLLSGIGFVGAALRRRRS